MTPKGKNTALSKGILPGVVVVLFLSLLFSSCASSLQKAKLNLAGAQDREKSFRTEEAVALYQKSLEEAEREIRKRPSSQAYMIKGLAEVKLARWPEASRSFSQAAALGDEKAEAWAREVSLLGLAISLQEQGLAGPALRLYSILSEKGKFSPVVQAALGRLVDSQLELLPALPEREWEKIITKSIGMVEKALDSDPACGYYHYLLAQLLGHGGKYRESFEEAVMARELGLPKLELQRDNDNQIVFCYRRLKESLAGEEWAKFSRNYRLWINKWKWPDEETPDWKRR
ncbi:MAG: hypothetical protein QHH43_03295 [Candidatus Saccharicenans sp.]|jgi:tetratricopeptide (TPR) repeat protein|nr:hypothetical protein [Candidatus Saccharicenans sp.]MDH7574771.1 hypothetical protein [Candidatus Saccharicenans sp.]